MLLDRIEHALATVTFLNLSIEQQQRLLSLWFREYAKCDAFKRGLADA